MKKLLITILLMSAICYGQNIRDNFSDALGAKWRPFLNQGDASATFDRNSDSTISPVNALGVGYYGGRFYDTTMNTGNIVAGFVYKQFEVGTTQRSVYAYLVNDTNQSTMDGYAIRVQESDGSAQGWARMYAVKNGSNTIISVADVVGNFAVNDTFLLIWYDNDVKTLQVRRANGTIDSTQYNTGLAASTGNDTIVNRRPMIRMEVANTAIKLDDFFLSAYPASGGIEPPPQPGGDTTAPVVETYAITPASWDTSTTGIMTVRVTDNSTLGLDSVYIRWDNADSVVAGITTTNDTTLYWSISKKTAGTYTYNVRVVDTAGNVTTSANKNLSVGTGHQFKGVAAYFTLDRMVDPSTLTKLSPKDVDYDIITHLIWFPAQQIIDPTTFPYWQPQYNEPPIASATDIRALKDWNIETANPYSGKDINHRYRKWSRDSLTARGHKMLLCIGGANSDDARFDLVFADSTKTQTVVDSSCAYAKLRGYDGISINWEFPNVPADFMRLLRLYRQELDTWNPVGILECCVYRSYGEISGYVGAMTTINECVDILNPMEYGFGQYAGIFGLNTGLYAAGCYGSYNSYIDNATIGIRNWLSSGADTAIVAGCYSFEMKITTQASGVSLCGTKTAATNFEYYQTAVNALKLPTTGYYWEPSAKVPYLIYPNGSNTSFLSYDDPLSIAEKGAYYKNLKLGYIWIWDLARGHLFDTSGGHIHDELLQAVGDVVGGIIDTGTTPLGAPTLVSPADNATELEKDSTVLIWNTLSGADRYYVQVSTNNLFSDIIFSSYPLDTVSAIAGNTLNYNASYYWRVAGGNPNWGSWSSIRSFTTKNQDTFYVAVTVPVLVSPSANATGQTVPLAFRWNTISTATTYQLILTADTSGSINITNQSLTDTVYTHLSSLTYSTAYYWKVRSMNTFDTSAYSGWRKFTYRTAPAEIPSSIGYVKIERPDGRKTNYSADYFNEIMVGAFGSIPVPVDTTKGILYIDPTSWKLYIKIKRTSTDVIGEQRNIDGTIP